MTDFNPPADRVRAIHDRLDRLVMGRGFAARHRVLRLFDLPEAAQFRDAVYAKLDERFSTALGMPSEETAWRARETRVRVSALFGLAA